MPSQLSRAAFLGKVMSCEHVLQGDEGLSCSLILIIAFLKYTRSNKKESMRRVRNIGTKGCDIHRLIVETVRKRRSGSLAELFSQPSLH